MRASAISVGELARMAGSYSTLYKLFRVSLVVRCHGRCRHYRGSRESGFSWLHQLLHLS